MDADTESVVYHRCSVHEVGPLLTRLSPHSLSPPNDSAFEEYKVGTDTCWDTSWCLYISTARGSVADEDAKNDTVAVGWSGTVVIMSEGASVAKGYGILGYVGYQVGEFP